MAPVTSPPHAARQHAAALIHLPPLLSEFGVPLAAVLEGTGVAPADLAPGRFIPYAAMLAILERAAVLTGCEDFGLRLGRRQGLDALGPLGRVMGSAATLGEALTDFARFQISNSTGSTVYAYRTANDFVLGYGIYDLGDRASAQIHDAVLAIGARLVADLSRGRVRPVEAWSMRPTPADPAPFRSLADGPVRFGQPQTCLLFTAGSAGFPLPGADRRQRRAALSALAAQMAPEPWGLAGEVRHALRALMLAGQMTMPEVATYLGLHPRSLRRGLAREGTSFEALRDEVRLAVARELLSLTPVGGAEITTTLSFANPSAFSRAFRRWTGETPSAWRQSHHTASHETSADP